MRSEKNTIANMRSTLLLLATACGLLAQPAVQNYAATASTTALTLQAPSTGTGVTIQGQEADVTCASAQTVTVKWNGTNATATAGTVLTIPGSPSLATATVWSGSNVGSGTTGPTTTAPAASPIRIDLSKFLLVSGGTASNVTIATGGTCTISIFWSERK